METDHKETTIEQGLREAFYQQTDKQTERTNAMLEQYLQGYIPRTRQPVGFSTTSRVRILQWLSGENRKQRILGKLQHQPRI